MINSFNSAVNYKQNAGSYNPKAYISQALEFRQNMQDKGYWVRLHKINDTIALTYGYTWSDGTKEQAIATRTFYQYKDKVEFITTDHV